MTEGFTNFVIDGNGNLIIPAEQSPNFVAGSMGWQIRADGSVEFNNGTFRGSIVDGSQLNYNGAPGAGNLVLAISPAAGADNFGNTWREGANLADTPFTPGPSSLNLGGINNVNPTGTLASFGNNEVQLNGPVVSNLFVPANVTILDSQVNLNSSDPVNGGVGANVLAGSRGWFVNDSGGTGKVVSIEGNPFVIKLGPNGHAIQPGQNSTTFKTTQRGTLTVPFSASAQGSATLTFPAAMPSAVYTVKLCAQGITGNTVVSCSFFSKTTTTVGVLARIDNGNTFTGNVLVDWEVTG